MSALVDGGKLAETIQVGVDFPPTDDFNEMAERRWKDCGPPEDVFWGKPGVADQFLQFLVGLGQHGRRRPVAGDNEGEYPL